MSDLRIVNLSRSILESAIDEWNRGLSQGPGKPTEKKALGDLIQQSRSRFPELYNLTDAPCPEATGAPGLLAWMLWFSALLDRSRLSSECLAPLKGALTRSISLLSTCGSVQESVEAAARRQVYELAYGLTHEINNPLGNIVARAQQLLSKSTDSYDRKSLATIVDQGMRAHEMLAELMRAVQPRRAELCKVELVSLVREAFGTAEALAKPKSLVWSLKQETHEAWSIVDRPGLLEALRLVSQNAIDACRENDSVLWTISKSESAAMITIEDTGPGLSPHAARRAFDLFYSGREAGRGLGVSLAVVRRLISESGGKITLSSEKQLGCRIGIEFPKAEAQTKGDDASEHGAGPRTWKL